MEMGSLFGQNAMGRQDTNSDAAPNHCLRLRGAKNESDVQLIERYADLGKRFLHDHARHGSWLANNQWVGHKFVQPHILSVFPWMILCHDDLEAVFTKWADRYFWVVRGGFYPTYIEFPLNHLVQYIVGLAILTTRFVYRSRSMAGRA